MTTTPLPTSTPAAADLTIGLPCTYGIGGDRYAEYIIRVERKGAVVVTAHRPPEEHAAWVADLYARKGESWLTARLVEQSESVYTRRPDGRYRPKGSTSGSLYFGEAVDYRDPSF